MAPSPNPSDPLPRLVELDAASRQAAQIVVLHDPSDEGANVRWALSLTDAIGRPIAREHVRLVDDDDLALRELARQHLRSIGMQPHGEWVASQDSAGPRHYARVALTALLN